MATLSEAEVDVHLQQFWTRAHGRLVRAPTVHELWHELEHVAELDGVSPLPTKREVLEHFSWFFSGAK